MSNTAATTDHLSGFVRDDRNNFKSIPLVGIVDDTDANRYAITRILRNAGYNVVSGSRGQHALELARQHKLDLLVLDVKMPDISGWDVCASLKRDPATSDIPVLQISASYTSDDDRVHGLDNGADGYLVQPVDPTVLVATARALMRMKFAHDAAQRSESRLRSVLECAPVILFAVNARGMYTLFTGSALGRLKLAAQSVVGQSLFVVNAGDERFIANAVRALNGESFVDDLCIHDRWFEVRYNPLQHASGDTQGFMAVATDITERKRAEQAREDLLAIVAHDLRTPLSGVSLGVRLLKRLLANPNPKFSTEATLASIERSARSAERLIADLLDGAKIQAGTFKVQPVTQSIEPLLREAVELLVPVARDKGISIRLEVPGPVVVPYDGSSMLQALCNLLGNAVKFAPESSVVTLAACCGEDGVTLSVRDEGPGIAEADLPYLFERFWQGKSKQDLGVGLGLSIAAGIVRAHGGRIWAENTPGGAAFYISLPFADPGQRTASPPASAS